MISTEARVKEADLPTTIEPTRLEKIIRVGKIFYTINMSVRALPWLGASLLGGATLCISNSQGEMVVGLTEIIVATIFATVGYFLTKPLVWLNCRSLGRELLTIVGDDYESGRILQDLRRRDPRTATRIKKYLPN